ncbi:MAG: alginate export family protein [Pseudomonadota bacterium]
MKKTHLLKFNVLTLNVCMALAGFAGSAYAEEAVVAEAAEPEYTFLEAIKDGKSLSSVRARYENVDQDNLQPAPNGTKELKNTYAYTTRTLIGWQTAPYKNFSFAAQITDVHEFNDDFNDRRGNAPEHNNDTAVSSLFKRQYANIVDPGFTDINQLYIDWTGIKNTKVRLGRQVVNLDNVRFVGDIAFRQNTQVFDGVSILNKSIPDTELFYSHFYQVRQINTEERNGNIDLINAKYRISPSEFLVGYGYFIDVKNLSQNAGNPAAAGFAPQGGNGLGSSQDTPIAGGVPYADASSKTFGLRLDGVHIFTPNWKGLYTAEYAKQDDYRGGNSAIDAHYIKIGGGAAYNTWAIRVDHEVLSSNDGKYAFQTPFGTNHLFQGWADHFLATPRQGIKDTFVTVSGAVDKLKIYSEYHVFKSDEKYETLGSTPANRRFGNKFGTEFDLGLTYPFNDNLWGKVEYAKFNESDVYGTTLGAAPRKADKEIVWLTAQYSF